MAISYLSKVIESNPYVLPVDLNLLAKVNSYKQSIFYKNADEVGNQLSQLKNADIANKAQHDLLLSKYNNLTSQLSQVGGVDYSDMNVTHQIEGFGADIYNDPTITKGIISTKMGRTLQSNYEKLKTDPKLAKYYSPANEWSDMQPFEEYVNGGIDASFNGSSSPTPYKGNPYTRLTEAVQKIKPNIEVGYGESGIPYFIDKTTRKTVDANQIYAAIDGTIDGDLLNQINIDARYNMRNYTPDQVLSVYTDNYNNKKASLEASLKYYENQIASEPSLSKKNEYIQGRDEVVNSLNDLNKNYHPEKFKNADNNTLNGLKHEIYTNRLFNNVIMSNKYVQKSTDLIVNQGEIQQMKINAALKLKELLKELEDGKKTSDIGIDGSLGTLKTNTETTDEAKAHEVTINTLAKENDNLNITNDKLIKSFIMESAAINPSYSDLLDVKTELSGDGSTTPTVQYSELLNKIAKLDNNQNLSINDIKSALQDPQLLNDKQKSFFNNIVNQYTAITEGHGDEKTLKDLAVSKSGLTSVLNDVALNQMAIEGNNTVIDRALESSPTYKGLDDAAKKFQKQIFKMGNYDENAPYMGVEYYDYMEGDAKTHYKKINTEIADKVKNLANRSQYYSKVFDTDKAKKLGLGSFILQRSKNNSLQNANVENIIPTSVIQVPGENKWKLSYQYQIGKDVHQSNPSEDVELNSSEIQSFGIAPIPHPNLENYVWQNGVSKRMYLKNDKLSGIDGLFSYDITRLGNDRNDNRFAIRIYDKDGVAPIVAGYNGKPFQSANEAYSFANDISQRFTEVYNNRQDFLNELRENAIK